MSLNLDLGRLLEVIGGTVHRKLLPMLPEASSARFSAVAVDETLSYARLLVENRQCMAQAPEGEAIRQRIKVLTNTIPDVSKQLELISILRADSRSYREQSARWRAGLARADMGSDRNLSLPTEAELTSVVQRWTGDPDARAHFIDAAVGGYSKQTILFDCIVGDGSLIPLVMRRDLPVGNLGTEKGATVVDEFPILKAVFKEGLVVAEPLFLESDPKVLVTPFLLSRRVPGRICGNSLGLGKNVGFDPIPALASLVARLHTIDVSKLNVPGFSNVNFDLQMQQTRIDQWIARYEANIDVPCAALELGLAWLRANAQVVLGQTSLVHGDVGYHNIMFDGGRVTALVDWELVHIGSPAEDLAYLKGIIDPFEPLLDLYVAQGAAKPTEAALTYCEMFIYIRNAIYGLINLRNFHNKLVDDIATVRISLESIYTYVDKLDQKLSDIIETRGFLWQVD